jgi:hypothetical protein
MATPLTDFFASAPWWILAVAAAGGVVLFYIGNRRLDKALQRAGIALTLLAILIGVFRFTFPSPRERLETRTRNIVKAVNQRDWLALKTLLDPNTTVGTPQRQIPAFERPSVAGRDLIVSISQRAVDVWGVKNVWVTGTESQQTETLITVALEVFSSQTSTQDRPVSSSWQFDYEQSGNQWVLNRITLLRVGQENGDQLFNGLRP